MDDRQSHPCWLHTNLKGLFARAHAAGWEISVNFLQESAPHGPLIIKLGGPLKLDACVRDALGRILVLYKANGNARRLSHEQQSEELRIMKELVCAVCAKD